MPWETVKKAHDCNDFLQAMSHVNTGPDHDTSFLLIALPPACDVDQALNIHFSTQFASPSPWSIGAVELPKDWQAHISPALVNWFFQLRYSPAADQSLQHALLENFFYHLRNTVGEPVRAYEVVTEPTSFYECAWADYIFEQGDHRWLLHLGVSD